MIKRPNRDVLISALDVYRDAMRPFIVRAMKRIKGKGIEDAIYDTLSSKQADEFELCLENNGNNIEGAIDIGDFPNIISRNWGQVFSQQFRGDMNVQSLLYLITQARNKTSHPSTEDLDTEYTRVVLYHVVDVLGKINAPEAKASVEKGRDTLFKVVSSKPLIPEPLEDTTHTPGSGSVELKPWREVIPPNIDLMQGTFEDAELAANLQEVYDGRASATSYGNPVSFYKQTYITAGMRSLLVNALKRLSGKGGAPVIQMQTGFGGGKTHSLIALYHIASSIDALVNISANSNSDQTRKDIERIIDEAQWDKSVGIHPKVAVLDGTYLSPTDKDKTKENGDPLNTLWGMMAYQLGGQEAYNLIGDAARRQDSAPLGAQLDKLFDYVGPCVVLMDELVAYLVNVGNDALGVNYTFIQALTESARRSRNVVLVVTLPESMSEAGGVKGEEILTTLAARMGRIESIWKPLQTDESFEVVRRRLFGNEIDRGERSKTCEAFIKMYNQDKTAFPQEVHEQRYLERMKVCYPIHPEIFERLHSDWSTIHDFQRTRGVLRLMAKCISSLYREDDRSPLILPANLPFDDSEFSSEFGKLLSGRWDPVFREAAVKRGRTDLIDQRRSNFAAHGGAARRIARTALLGSCPGRSIVGIGVNRIHLGVAQPGRSISVYTDALNEMSGNLYYFYADDNRYYFHTEENLNKVVIDRINEFDGCEINKKIVDEIRDAVRQHKSRVIVCPKDLDEIRDLDELRLVILPPDKVLPTKEGENDTATPAALHILKQQANATRTNRNTLLFLAAKKNEMNVLRGYVREFLAWESITEGDRKIPNLIGERQKQAIVSRQKAGESMHQAIPKAYNWAIAPAQLDPQHDEFQIFPEKARISDDGDIVKSAFDTFKAREAVIEYNPPESLDRFLKEYIWNDRNHIRISELWNMMAQYVYMPRLINRDVLTKTIEEGVQGGIFGYAAHYDAEQQDYHDVYFDEALELDNLNGLLIKLEVVESIQPPRDDVTPDPSPDPSPDDSNSPDDSKKAPTEKHTVNLGSKRIIITKTIEGELSLDDIRDIDQEIIALLSTDGGSVTVEITVNAYKAEGFSQNIERSVKNNSAQLNVEMRSTDQ